MWIFNRPPPPIYQRKPIATIAVVLTMVAMFVLGPVGVIYDTMSEDLKQKANNETVLLYMKQQKETDDRQWKAIERRIGVSNQVQKKPVPPELYNAYIKLKAESRPGYKIYLEGLGYNTRGLPN
jgi:hypothetical protein